MEVFILLLAALLYFGAWPAIPILCIPPLRKACQRNPLLRIGLIFGLGFMAVLVAMYIGRLIGESMASYAGYGYESRTLENPFGGGDVIAEQTQAALQSGLIGAVCTGLFNWMITWPKSSSR